MKNLSFLLILAFFSLCCGGGGGGGGSSSSLLNYEGISDPVALTEDNVDDMASTVIGSDDLFGGVTNNKPGGYRHYQLLRRTLVGTRSKARLATVQAKDEVVYGDVNGYVILNGKIDDVTGYGSLVGDYFNYSDDGITFLQGKMTIAESASVSRIVMSELIIQDRTNSVEATGTLRFTASGTTQVASISLAMVDRDTGMEYLLSGVQERLVFSNSAFVGSFESSLSGTFYQSDLGHVTVSTVTPFTFSSTSATSPLAGGVIMMEGADASRAMITSLGSTVSIDVDADGDGVYEESSITAWSSLSL